MTKMKCYSIHEEMLFTYVALHLPKECEVDEIAYEVHCYDGFAIGIKLNEKDPGYKKIVITYPTREAISTEEYVRCLIYRGIENDSDSDTLKKYESINSRFPEDICVALGRVLPNEALELYETIKLAD